MKYDNLVLERRSLLNGTAIDKDLAEVVNEDFSIMTSEKDAIKADLGYKFHSVSEPTHHVSATQLIWDNLNAEL